MEENRQPKRISKEEYDKIMSLPKRTFIIGNINQTGLFDESSRKFYFLNEDGSLSGKVASIRRPQSQPPQDEDTSDSRKSRQDDELPDESTSLPGKLKRLLKKPNRTHDEGSDDDTEDADEAEDDDAPGKLNQKIGKLPITWKQLIIFIAAAVILLILLSTFLKRNSQQPSPPVEDTPPVEEVNDPSLNTIQVVQVVYDLIPGDIISSDNIQASTITAESFNQITLGGTNIYQWDRVDSLMGKCVTAYIPAGQYLAYTNVASTYIPASNPWVNEQVNRTYVTVPLDEATAASTVLNFGAKMDISLKKETLSETTLQDGVIQQTTTIKPYTFENVIVCDILNANQESIYPKYTAYMEIPVGEQLTYIRKALTEQPDLQSTLTPAYIRIKIDSALAEEIGDFSSNKVTLNLSLHNANDIDVTNDQKREYAAQARALSETIRQAIQLNAEAALAEDGGSADVG